MGMKFRTGLLLGATFVAGLAAGPTIGVLDRTVGWPIAYARAQDGSRGHAYRTLLPLLIRDWRTRWGRGDFPFLVQQLPNWNASGAEGSSRGPWTFKFARGAEVLVGK